MEGINFIDMKEDAQRELLYINQQGIIEKLDQIAKKIGLEIEEEKEEKPEDEP